MRREAPELWIVRLDQVSQSVSWSLISDEETRFARSLGCEALRRRVVARRASLRALLGSASSVSPADISIESGPYGKPFVQLHDRMLHFSLAHRCDLAIVAITSLAPIGVDLEVETGGFDPGPIISRFHASERSAIAAVPDHLRRQSFLRCWTAKEAMLKAVGTGLTQPLDSVVVDPDPRHPLRLIRSPPPTSAAEWTLQPVNIGIANTTCATAVMAPDVPSARVRRFVPDHSLAAER
jgi:4'-phosphopantetheinyl transferase